ncbi:MAG: hypothetical protein R3F40_18545 [Candidatus Competibacteraceae bacterium]
MRARCKIDVAIAGGDAQLPTDFSGVETGEILVRIMNTRAVFSGNCVRQISKTGPELMLGKGGFRVAPVVGMLVRSPETLAVEQVLVEIRLVGGFLAPAGGVHDAPALAQVVRDLVLEDGEHLFRGGAAGKSAPGR